MDTKKISIYIEDHAYLKDLCKKGESFRDKLKTILNEWMEQNKVNGDD